jgi:hypothetical protein
VRFSLDVIRARKGDCLMLHYGTPQKPGLILIDGGPSNVYNPQLKPRIDAIRTHRQLKPEDSLPIDLLMVSHVDDDHIKGILDLTRELRQQRDAKQPLLVRVASLWHNSFDDLLGKTPKELTAQAALATASLSGPAEVPQGDEFDAAMVLASIPQGRTLRDDADFLKWKRNRELDGKLILATGKSKPIALDGGLELTVVGPLQPELLALQKAHDKWLKEQAAKKKKDPDAALAAFVDESVPNLSSLVVLAKVGTSSMLLTGDARGDKVLEGLELTKLIGKTSKSTLHVDLLKVPHHGSANNVETKFFERVTADHYVFSGNGEHGNPERETLEMLFTARPKAAFTMYFTYPIDEIDVERKKDWEKQRALEIKRKKKKVRPVWSPKQHGLKEFFDKQKPRPDQKIQIVPSGGSHVIDLLDATGF